MFKQVDEKEQNGDIKEHGRVWGNPAAARLAIFRQVGSNADRL